MRGGGAAALAILAVAVAGCGERRSATAAATPVPSLELPAPAPTPPAPPRLAPARDCVTAGAPFPVQRRTVAMRRRSTISGGVRRLDPVVWSPPRTGCARPMILYSHGHDGDPSSCSVLCTRLARAGFLVVAPHHDDRAELRYQEQAAERVDDATAVLDHLRLRHDPRRTGAAGHSFGGITAGELASQDRRVHAVLSMAGTPDLATMRTLAVPTLLMAGTRDPIETVQSSRTAERAIAPTVPHRLLVVEGARHGQLIDGCAAIGACDQVGRAAERFFTEHLLGADG